MLHNIVMVAAGTSQSLVFHLESYYGQRKQRHYVAFKSENNSELVDVPNKIILYLLIKYHGPKTF